jgi:hypothetical protein
MFSDPSRPRDFLALISGGQLLLVGGALCGGAIAELLATPKKHPLARQVCAGTSTFLVACGAGAYALLVERIRKGETIDNASVAYVSITIYLVGFISALSCIVIAESAKREPASIK